MKASMKAESKVNILDCTLRDGGYYTNWHFDFSLVNTYLAAAAAAGIEFIELGYRLPYQGSEFGAFYKTSDSLVESLKLPEGLILAVMSDVNKLLRDGESVSKTIDSLYTFAGDSPITMVRLAVHFKDISHVRGIAEQLLSKGYQVAINLMQTSLHNDETIRQVIKSLRNDLDLKVLYFADSLGALEPQDVCRIINIIQSEWKGAVGLHAHDNTGRALQNSLTALEAGATFVDGTILGFGRGAGNACTEYLLLELEQIGTNSYHPAPLFSLVHEEFKELKEQYKWGSSLPYYLAGRYQIHPTYVQRLLSDSKIHALNLYNILQRLRERKAHSFSTTLLEEEISSSNSN